MNAQLNNIFAEITTWLTSSPEQAVIGALVVLVLGLGALMAADPGGPARDDGSMTAGAAWAWREGQPVARTVERSCGFAGALGGLMRLVAVGLLTSIVGMAAFAGGLTLLDFDIRALGDLVPAMSGDLPTPERFTEASTQLRGIFGR